MANIPDICVSAAINVFSAFAFLVAFAIIRLQPVNDRVYFPKWYLKGIRGSPRSGRFVSNFVNLDFRTYIRFLNWMPAALKMPEPELIDHAGLDSAAYIRIYLLGLVLVMILGQVFLFQILGTHLVMTYVFSLWTFYVLYKEYRILAHKRLQFLGSENGHLHQFTIINVYNQKYESGAAFWSDVHQRIIIGMVISQLLLMGLLSTKEAANSTPLLIVLPILTIWFHIICKGRFESAFVKFPLQDAMVKDTLERATEPNLNLKAYLSEAYVHPVFKGDEMENSLVINEEENNPLVPSKRTSLRSSKMGSNVSSEHGKLTRLVRPPIEWQW